MDFGSDSDYYCDGGGGVSDFGHACYGGYDDDYYHDSYGVGDFDVDIDIGGDIDVGIHAGDDLYGGYYSEAEFSGVIDVGIHAGGDLYGEDDLEAEFGGDERDLAAEFGNDGLDDSDGDVHIAAELGFGDGDYDINGDGLSAAEYGIDIRDGTDGEVDIEAELGLGDDDYFNDTRDIAAGFVVNGGDYDVDGDGLSAAGGDDFADDRDFDAEFGVHEGDDDMDGDGGRHLLEAESVIDGDDLFGDRDLEAVTAYEVDDGGDVLVPVVEVDDDEDDNNDNGGDELVPVVEVDDDDDSSDFYHYYSNGSGAEHHLLEDLDDLESLVYTSRRSLGPETAFRLQRVQLDGDEDLVVNRDNDTSTREITVQASPLMNLSGVERLIESNSNPNVRRNEEEKDGEMTSSSEEAKKDSNANGSENDGVSCPICFEPWTTDGDHIICCLPCGHVYGMSCIKSWLQQPNSGKCPLCNKVCSVDGIRKIYGLTIVTAEKDLKEKIQLLEARCASLELNNGEWQRKEAEWRQSEAVLLQQLKPNTNN